MTTPSVVKLCTLAVCSLVALSACDKKKNDVPTNGEQSVVTPVTGTQQADLSCDSASVKNSLVQALSEQTHQAVNGLMGDFANSSAIDLPRLVQARLAELGLDFQNIRQDGAVCIADMVIRLPSDDIAYANRYYAQTDTDLGTLMAQHSLVLDGTQLTDSIRYGVTNGQAVLFQRPEALNLVASIMSGSAYMRKQGVGQVNLNARRPITVAPLTANIEPARQSPSDSSSHTTASTIETPTADTSSILQDNSTTTIKSDTIPTAPTAKPINKVTTPSNTTTPSGEHELVIIEGDDTY